MGWKWSVASERHGVPIGWTIDGANRNDIRLLDDTLAAVADASLLADIDTLRMMAKLSTRRYAAGLEPVGQARGRYWSVGDLLRVSVDLLTDGIMIGTGSLIASSLGFVLALGQVPATSIVSPDVRGTRVGRSPSRYPRCLTPKLQTAPAQQAGAVSS